HRGRDRGLHERARARPGHRRGLLQPRAPPLQKAGAQKRDRGRPRRDRGPPRRGERREPRRGRGAARHHAPGGPRRGRDAPERVAGYQNLPSPTSAPPPGTAPGATATWTGGAFGGAARSRITRIAPAPTPAIPAAKHTLLATAKARPCRAA